MRAQALQNKIKLIFTHTHTHQKTHTADAFGFQRNLHEHWHHFIFINTAIINTLKNRGQAVLSDWKPVNMFFHKTFYLLRSIFFCRVLLDLNGESHFKIPAVISERSKGQLKLSKFGTAVFLFSSSSHWCWDFNAASDTMWLSNMWFFFVFFSNVASSCKVSINMLQTCSFWCGEWRQAP